MDGVPRAPSGRRSRRSGSLCSDRRPLSGPELETSETIHRLMEDIMTASKASPRTSSLESTLVHPETVAPETTATRIVRYSAVALRLSLGFTFLWAFFDKTFGLGHETKS